MSNSSIVVCVFSVASVICFVIGFAIQNWSCIDDCGPQTGGKNDATWGTYVTDYILGMECFVMAVMAPGDGFVKKSIAAAYIIAGVSWTAGGILHHMFPTDGQVHVMLWIVALIGGGWAALVRAYAAIVSMQESGKCVLCLDSKILGIVFGVLAATYVIAVPLSVQQVLPLADWMLMAMTRILFDLVLIITGYMAKQPLWTSGVLASFLLFLALNVIKFPPFIYSTSFNDNGLFHSAVMLYLAMLFGFFDSIASAPTSAPKSAPSIDRVETKHNSNEHATCKSEVSDENERSTASVQSGRSDLSSVVV